MLLLFHHHGVAAAAAAATCKPDRTNEKMLIMSGWELEINCSWWWIIKYYIKNNLVRCFSAMNIFAPFWPACGGWGVWKLCGCEMNCPGSQDNLIFFVVFYFLWWGLRKFPMLWLSFILEEQTKSECEFKYQKLRIFLLEIWFLGKILSGTFWETRIFRNIFLRPIEETWIF